MARALEGLRILDFTHVLAGPFATRVLGDLGADVVKVHSHTRTLGAGAAPSYPYYVMWNRNKRCLALDMSKEEARAIGRALAERADVVIENFSVGVLDRWGLGFESVRAANPRVIYVSMSGMGKSGPWAGFVTYAPTVHALAGLTYLTGVPGREDIGVGFSYNDHLAGLHAAVVVLAAVEARRRSGRGQLIDLSQFEVGVNFAAPALMDYFANGRVAEPAGNRLPYDAAAPHNCYPCAGDDRWIAIAVMDDTQWASLKRVMGHPAWAGDERYESVGGRAGGVEELDARIAAWTRERDAYGLQTALQEAGVPAGVVQTGEDLVERDPQLKSREFFTTTEDEHAALGGAQPVDRLPLQFSATPVTEYRAARGLGADNASVLADWLGMGEPEVRAREEDGTLA